MATIDRLELEIEVQASGAGKQLDILTAKLGILSKSLMGVGLGKSTSLTSLNQNLKQYSTNANVAKKSTKSLASSIGRFYAFAFLAIRGVKALGRAIESSMDFLETVNYFEVAMRQIGNTAASGWEEAGYNSAEAYAESFSTRAKQLTKKMTGYAIDKGGNAAFTGKKSLGLDPSKVMQNQAVFAQISSSIGVAEESAMNFSKALTMLGADWASLRNITFDQSWEKFASALAGQSRAVRSLGIDITMATLQEVAYANGVRTAVSEMNQATKAQLRLLAIMEQSEVAFGDLANTISSPANQIRLLQQNFANLARTIGNLFLPILSKILPVVNGIVIALQRLFTWIGGLLGIKFDSINSSMGGMSDSMSDLVGGTDNYEESLEDANKAAKKLKSTVLGIDELNINAPETDSGANKPSGSVGGGMPELDLKIADALAEYEKVWNDAFDRMQNKAQEFADKIEKAFRKIWEVAEPTRIAIKKLWEEGLSELGNFTWNTLGDFYRQFLVPVGKWMLGNDAGLPRLFNILNDMLTDIDWGKLRNSLYNLYGNLSDLTIFAFDGLFDFFDYFLAPLGTWAIGSALPQLADILSRFIEDVNWEKINAALERFWKALLPFAQAVGQGIINFYSDLMKVGAGFINAIVPGGINLLAAAFEKIDPRTVERIAYALSAFVTAYVGFKAISKVKGIVVGALGTLYSSTVLSGLKNVTTKIMGFADTIPIVTSALKGNKEAADALATFYPKLNKSIVGVSDAFGTFKANLQSGAFFKNTLTDLRSFGEGLSGIQKGAIGAVAVFAQFNVMSNVFEDLVLGTENFVAGIGKIAIAAGLASVALYTVFGPVGLVISAITGVVAAVVGIDKAMDEIKAEAVGNSIKNALINPGGTPLEEIASKFSKAMSEMGGGFSVIAEKSQELSSAEKNIQNVWLEIEGIEKAMDAGVLSVEEGKAKLETLFGTLATLTEQKFQTMELALLAAYGENGALSQAMDRMGTSTETAIDSAVATLYNGSERVKEIVTEMQEVDPTSENYKKLEDELKQLSLQIDDFSTAASDYSYTINGLDVDYSSLILEDGTLNDAELTKYLDTVSGAVKDYESELDTAGKNVAVYWQQLYDAAKTQGDFKSAEEYKAQIDMLPKAISLLKEDANLKAKELTDDLQMNFVGGINEIIENAQSKWQNLDPMQKFWAKLSGESEETYVQDAINKQTENLNTLSNTVEEQMGQLGIKGAGWSYDAAKEIYSGLFDTQTIFSEFGSKVKYDLKDNYQGIVTGALGAAQTEIEKQAKEFGKDTVSGYGGGVEENSDGTIQAIKSWMSKNVDAIHDSAMKFGSPSLTAWNFGRDTVFGYNNGVVDNAESTTTAINTWLSSITELFNPEKWSEMYGNVFLGFQTKWTEFTALWSEELMPLWFEEGVTPWFSAEKWMEATDGMKLGITGKWTEFTVLWKTNFTKWWTADLEPWFTTKKWEELLTNIPVVFESTFINSQTIVNDQMKNMYDVIAEWVEMIKSVIAEVGTSIDNIISSVDGMSANISVKLGAQIPKFELGGFPEDGLFFANHNELVGQFSNGRTAVANNDMITSGIEEAAYRGFVRANAENNQEAGLLRELIEAVREGKIIEIDGREIVSVMDERRARNGYPLTT